MTKQRIIYAKICLLDLKHKTCNSVTSIGYLYYLVQKKVTLKYNNLKMCDTSIRQKIEEK